MSKLFGRVGTSAMKYQFELQVTSLHMSIPLTTPMCVKWTRGPRTATNQPVAGVNGEYNWPAGKPMQIVATMYYKKNKFQEKKSKLTVKQLLGKELKSVGQAEIDLAEFCADKEVTRPLTLKLQKCSDKKAFLICTIKSKWLKALQASDANDDTASQLSGASSVDARSESNIHATDVANINDLDGMEDAEEASPQTSDDEEPSTSQRGATASTPSASSTVPAGGAVPIAHLKIQPAAGAAATTSSGPSAATLEALQQKDQTINEQSEQIEQLKSKVTELTAAVNAERGAAAKNLTLQTQLSELQSSYTTLQKEKQDAETEHETTLVKVRTDLKNATSELEKAQNEKQLTIRSFETQLNEQKAENEKLKTRMSSIQEEADVSRGNSPNAASGDASTAARMQESFDKERQVFEKQIRELRSELAQASSLTHDAFARLSSQESKLKEVQEEHKVEYAAREKEVERLERTVAENEMQTARLQDELKQRDASLIDLRRAEKELKNELTNAQTNCTSEQTRRETIEKHLEEMERSVQESRTNLLKIEREKELELKNVRAQLIADKEKVVQEQTESRNRMQKEHEAALAAAMAAAASSAPASTSAPSDANAAAIAEKDTLIANLNKKVEDYSLRIVSIEEERARLEQDLSTAEAALSKQKEDELIMLEERYEENYKFKKMIKEKENEVDELSKGARENAREARESKQALEKAQKELREKVKLIEAAEANIETMSNKLAKAAEESKKSKLLMEQSSSRIRELEVSVQKANESLETSTKDLAEKEKELERAQTRRREIDEEAERVQANLKQSLEKEISERESERKALAAEKAAALEAAAAAAATVTASPSSASNQESEEAQAASKAALAAAVASAEEAKSELLYTQGLLLKRNQELGEIESQTKDLKSKLRSFEELEEKFESLTRREKENEIAFTKKLELVTREKVGVEEELAVLREKRERERIRKNEREEKDKESRLLSLQAASENQSIITNLQVDLENANAKIDVLQEQLAEKQSKISEQQDKLNGLIRSGESQNREFAETKEQLNVLQAKWDHLQKNHSELSTRYESEKNTSQSSIAKLEKELEEQHQRRMVFDALSSDAVAALKKDKPSAALLESLQKKIEFYEQQLEDADESMVLAKQSWIASSGVLQTQLESMEKTHEATKLELLEARESRGVDSAKVTTLETKLRKAEKDKSKLSELMSRFEVELTQKKTELAASLDQLATQEYENERLKTQLSKQMKLCENHVAELNKTRSG